MTSTCLIGDVNFDFLFKVVSVRLFHFKAAVSPISNLFIFMKITILKGREIKLHLLEGQLSKNNTNILLFYFISTIDCLDITIFLQLP